MRAFRRDLQENLLIGLWESQNKYLKIRLPTAIYSTAACKNSLDNLLLAVLSEAHAHTHCASTHGKWTPYEGPHDGSGYRLQNKSLVTVNSRISSNGKKWNPLWFWKLHMQNPLCLNLSHQSLLNLEDKPLAAVIIPHHPQSGNEMRTLPAYNSNGLLEFPVCSEGSMNPPLLWNTHSSFLRYHGIIYYHQRSDSSETWLLIFNPRMLITCTSFKKLLVWLNHPVWSFLFILLATNNNDRL